MNIYNNRSTRGIKNSKFDKKHPWCFNILCGTIVCIFIYFISYTYDSIKYQLENNSIKDNKIAILKGSNNKNITYKNEKYVEIYHDRNEYIMTINCKNIKINGSYNTIYIKDSSYISIEGDYNEIFITGKNATPNIDGKYNEIKKISSHEFDKLKAY